MPHKFWQARYGEGLRKIVADGGNLRALVDFSDQQVFKGVTTYTAVHVMSRAEGLRSVDYVRVAKLEDGTAQCVGLDSDKQVAGTERFKAREPVGSEPWVFTNEAESKWLDKVRSDHRTLGEITYKIAQGLVSGCDPVFYVEQRGSVWFSHQTGRTHEIEKELLRPLLKGSLHIRRWAMDPTPLAVIFPYQTIDGDWKLLEPELMESEYPQAYAYLSECRGKLEEREKTERRDDKGNLMRNEAGQVEYGRPFSGSRFYRFSRPQNFEIMPRAKLLVPAMAQCGEYAIDRQGEYYFVGSGGGGGGAHAILPNVEISLEYLCGLLNSRCLDSFLQKVSTPFHSGWFAYSKLYLAQIPIKLPSTAEDKKLADRITASVRAIMDAKVALRAPHLSDREKAQHEATVESHEKRIDEAVFALYGVPGLPDE